jgi:hypothetical protein
MSYHALTLFMLSLLSCSQMSSHLWPIVDFTGSLTLQTTEG